MEDYSDAIEYTRGSMLGSGAFGQVIVVLLLPTPPKKNQKKNPKKKTKILAVQVFSVLNARTGVIMAMKEIKLQMTSKNVEKVLLIILEDRL